jgi:hypothetical protein
MAKEVDPDKKLVDICAKSKGDLSANAAKLVYRDLLRLNGWKFPGYGPIENDAQLSALTIADIFSIAQALEKENTKGNGGDDRTYQMGRTPACCSCV